MKIELKLEKLSKILGSRFDSAGFKEKLFNFNTSKNEIIIKNKQIFLDFQQHEYHENALDKLVLEHLEIALQILINQGYNIVVYCSNNIQSEKCKTFVDNFRNELIQFENSFNIVEVINRLCESEISIVMSEEYLCYSFIFEKPCIPVFIDEKLLKLLNIIDCAIENEGFNAGVVLEKVKYVEKNYDKIRQDIASYFDIEEKIPANRYERTGNQSQKSNDTDHMNIDAPSDGMEAFKIQIKQKIQALIEEFLLNEAKQIISEYEEIVNNDIDIYSMKGVIAIMEGDLGEAERVLKAGFDIEPLNTDLLYNLAYLYEISTKYVLAYKSYRSLFHCADETIKDEVKEKVKQLEEIDEVNVYLTENQDEIKAYELIEKMQQQIKELKEITM